MVCPGHVTAGAVVRASEVAIGALIHILTLHSSAEVAVPALAIIGAVAVDAGRKWRTDLPWPLGRALVAFVHVLTVGPIAMVTFAAVTVEGAVVRLAYGVAVACAAGVQAVVQTHARALLIGQTKDAGTGVRTQSVAARHVPVAHAAGPAFIHVFTFGAIAVVTISALAEVGSVRVAAVTMDAAVVG